MSTLAELCLDIIIDDIECVRPAIDEVRLAACDSTIKQLIFRAANLPPHVPKETYINWFVPPGAKSVDFTGVRAFLSSPGSQLLVERCGTSLEHLKLNQGQYLRAESFDILSIGCPNIAVLEMNACRLDDPLAFHIQFKNLVELNVSSTDITEKRYLPLK